MVNIVTSECHAPSTTLEGLEPYQKLGPPPASLQVTHTVARVSDKAPRCRQEGTVAAEHCGGRALTVSPNRSIVLTVCALTNGKADYWTYIQEAIWSMSSDDEDQQSYLKSSSLVSP